MPVEFDTDLKQPRPLYYGAPSPATPKRSVQVMLVLAGIMIGLSIGIVYMSFTRPSYTRDPADIRAAELKFHKRSQ